MNFLASLLLLTPLVSLYLSWSVQQTEKQIDQMQESAFNSPGVEAPIPPAVPLGALGLAALHLTVGSRFLRLKPLQAWLSLVFGATAGTILYLSIRSK